MAWQQLHFTIHPQFAEELEESLLTFKALSITLQDAENEPIFEPQIGSEPLWSMTRLTALFTLETDVQKIVAKLQQQYPQQIIDHKIDTLADQNWERAWLKYFKPMQFGKQLWIIPTGYEVPDKKATNIMLDPGLAFGTGTHPTTAMCLQWLANNDIQNKTVIDYGCGSGILAIAALKLGASDVWAIDYDPQALTATKENAKRNNIDANRLHTGLNEDLPDDYQADLLLANILANPLTTLASTLTKHVKNNLVLSGILSEQVETIINIYQLHFSMQISQQQEDWSCLIGMKKNGGD